MNKRDKLSDFLEWLITPQDEIEQTRFKDVVDDYINIKTRIPEMSEEELIKEINIQLAPYNLSVK